MQRPIDFSKLSLDELTPIVSMRPGKEYTREELKEARAAFMAALSSDTTESESKSENKNLDTDEKPFVHAQEVTTPKQETPEVSEEEAVSASDASEDITLEQPAPFAFTNAVDHTPATSENSVPSKMEEITGNAPSSPVESVASAPESCITEPTQEKSADETSAEEASVVQSPGEEEFILKAESRLARFLYILYAYMLLPILAAESLVFLLASVGAAIMVRDVPFATLHILAAVLYTMVVSLAWHQFMHRTKVGLLLNRSLIGVCIFRGLSMILSGTSLMTGIIYVALSVLYLVFFVAYDSTFVIPSQD